jgi:hypothetical protein
LQRAGATEGHGSHEDLIEPDMHIGGKRVIWPDMLGWPGCAGAQELQVDDEELP